MLPYLGHSKKNKENYCVFNIGGALWPSEHKPDSKMLKQDWTHVLDFAFEVAATSAMETEMLALACGVVCMSFTLLPRRLQISLPDVTTLENCVKLATDIERNASLAEPSL